jgi:type IV pilus assembly protein PilV
MNPSRPCRHPRRQRGASLLEVLIAILILAIGMLGVAAMQAMSLRNSLSALERSQATVQTYAILDAMRANIVDARANQYNLALAAAPCPVPAAGATLPTRDLSNWIGSLQATLGPSACGGVACAANVCEITIRWNDERGSGGVAAQQLITRSRI